MKNLNRSKTFAIVALTLVMSLCMGSVMANIAVSDPVHVTDNYELALVVSTGLLATGSLALRYAPNSHTRTPHLAMAIAQEIWVDRIVELLFPDNSILSKVRREDDRVLGGSVVHIPQAGAGPAVEKNRSSFPGVAVRRTDTDITYPLDIYTSDPVHITAAELMEISYDKMDSVLKGITANVGTAVTLDMLYAWAASSAGQILRTTGALVGTNLSPTATGTRRTITSEDFKAAMVLLNSQDVPEDGRIALLDAVTFGELLSDPLLTGRDIQKLAEFKTGKVGELYGFTIMQRSSNTLFSNAGTPVKKAVGAASAATDNKSSLFFQTEQLHLAMGEVKFFETLNDAMYYGDVYSALVKAGGRQGREDGKGVVSIVQAAS